MLTTLLTQVHTSFASLPSAILTALLIVASLVVLFIAVLPSQYTLLKAVALAYVVLP